MIGAIKRHLPWWAKIGAKLALSRAPAAYAVWQRMGLFRHGPYYLWDVLMFQAWREQFGGACTGPQG